jgi:membrane fusion protein (multidrug efflux system)
VNVLNKQTVLITAFLVPWLGIMCCDRSGINGNEPQEISTASAAVGVRAVPVALEDWSDNVPISGTLETLSSVDVRAEVGGRLVAVHAREGDLVHKGELLAEIDDTNFELAFRQSSAALRVAQAGLERARISAGHAAAEKVRADNLLESGGITQKDHQAALTAMKESEAQVALSEAQCLQAEAAMAIAEKALKDCLIAAPAEGHVQKRWMDEGSLPNAGNTLFSLVDNRRLELKCVVPSYRLSSLKTGRKVVFTTPSWGETAFTGSLFSINPAVEQDSRSVIANIRVENPDMKLRSGMFARGYLTVGTQMRVPVIERDALIPGEGVSGSARVFVVEDGKARLRRIQIGGEGGNLVWIREGLEAGELLVIERGPSLSDGTDVYLRGEDKQGER